VPKSDRRLAAIVVIDVAGYSRLMTDDEEGTLARLKAHRAPLPIRLVSNMAAVSSAKRVTACCWNFQASSRR